MWKELEFIAEGEDGRRNADRYRVSWGTVTSLERRALVETVRDFRSEGDLGPLVSVTITERGRACLSIKGLTFPSWWKVPQDARTTLISGVGGGGGGGASNMLVFPPGPSPTTAHIPVTPGQQLDITIGRGGAGRKRRGK